MERGELSSNIDSEDDYKDIKRIHFPDEYCENICNSDDDLKDLNGANTDRPRILPPTEKTSSHENLQFNNCEQYANDEEYSTSVDLKPQIESAKSKRPRILPPEHTGSEENDIGRNGIINFKTRRMRTLSHDIEHSRDIKRGRFLVRINEDCRSRSNSPLRQVIVDRPLEYAKYSRKCRNYEELGYCLAGNNCPYSHGPNTIVVDGLYGYSNIHPSYLAGKTSSIPAMVSTHAAGVMDPPPAVALASNALTQPQQQHPTTKKRRPTCSLLVRKIPSGFVNIAKINDYFGRFGNIQHIQVAFGGKPDEALIRYADVESALRAYRCQEPIFSNRFVHLRWYDDTNNDNDSNFLAHSMDAMPTPQNSFGMFSTIPTPPTAHQTHQGPTSVLQSRNLSKTYNTAAANASVVNTSSCTVSIIGMPAPPAEITLSHDPMPVSVSSGDSTTTTTTENLLQSAQRTRDHTTLRPLSKRFTAKSARSLELKSEQERLLGAKTDLYLKLSEQVRIVLLNAKGATDSKTRQRWLKMVNELQTNMDELGESVRKLYASVHPGRRALDLGAIVSSNTVSTVSDATTQPTSAILRQRCQ